MKPLKELIEENAKQFCDEMPEYETSEWTGENIYRIAHIEETYKKACFKLLEELSKSAGDEFNETAARDHFHRENPALYRDGVYLNKKVSYAKWQWEQDNLIIQSLRLRIAELEGTMKPLKEQVPSA